jgi:hypothetical protein
MEYEAVVVDEAEEETQQHAVVQRQRRAMYGCFAAFVVTKLLVACWILTTSFPLDPIGSLFRGEWWGDDRN